MYRHSTGGIVEKSLSGITLVAGNTKSVLNYKSAQKCGEITFTVALSAFVKQCMEVPEKYAPVLESVVTYLQTAKLAALNENSYSVGSGQTLHQKDLMLFADFLFYLDVKSKYLDRVADMIRKELQENKLMRLDGDVLFALDIKKELWLRRVVEENMDKKWAEYAIKKCKDVNTFAAAMKLFSPDKRGELFYGTSLSRPTPVYFPNELGNDLYAHVIIGNTVRKFYLCKNTGRCFVANLPGKDKGFHIGTFIVRGYVKEWGYTIFERHYDVIRARLQEQVPDHLYIMLD